MQKRQTLYEQIELTIRSRNLLYPLDILLVGATGVGKSSTVNAIFNRNIAQVGAGVEPMTQNIDTYSLNDFMRFHDSPDLGDSILNDIVHKKKLIKALADTTQY